MIKIKKSKKIKKKQILLSILGLSIVGLWMGIWGYINYEKLEFSTLLNGPDAWWMITIFAFVHFWILMHIIHLVRPKLKMIKFPVEFLRKTSNALTLLACIAIILGGVFLTVVGYEQYLLYKDIRADPEKEPYLTWVHPLNTSTSMTITWETNNEELTTLQYGTDIANLQSIDFGEQTARTHHTHTLLDLQPNTLYYYKVNGFNSTYNFTTPAAPASAQNVKFIVYGDNRYNGDSFDSCRHDEIVKAITERYTLPSGELDFNFTINVGDVVHSGGMDYQWTMFHREIVPLATSKPYMIAFGNHEYYGGNDMGTEDEGANAHFHWEYNEDSGDEFDYWYSVGNAMFIVFGSGEYWDVSQRTVDWMNDTLKEYADDYDWIFTADHHPFINHGNSDNQVYNKLFSLIEDYGVDVSLTGHVHDYQRLHDPALNYTHIVTGGGGASLENEADDMTITNVTFSEYHYMEWILEGNHARAKAIAINGTILDEFELFT